MRLELAAGGPVHNPAVNNMSKLVLLIISYELLTVSSFGLATRLTARQEKTPF